MQIDAGKYRECRELLMFSFENDLTAEQNERLNQLLEEDAVRHYYLDLVELSQNLKDIHWPDNDVVPLTDQEVWQLLAQYEKEAQPIVIPEQKPPIELITNVRQRKAQLRSALKNSCQPLAVAGLGCGSFDGLVLYDTGPRNAQS